MAAVLPAQPLLTPLASWQRTACSVSPVCQTEDGVQQSVWGRLPSWTATKVYKLST